MIETIDPLASAGLAAAAALAAWLADRRRHRRLVRDLQTRHRREHAVADDQLATARLQIASLKKEMAQLQARWVRDRVPRPAVQAAVRAPAVPAPARVESKRPHLTLVEPPPPGPAADGPETGFPDTQPWECERR